MHGGEEIWEWAVCKRTAVRVFFSLLRDRCKLKKRKAERQSQSLSRGVVKLTGRPARNAAATPRASCFVTWLSGSRSWTSHVVRVCKGCGMLALS